MDAEETEALSGLYEYYMEKKLGRKNKMAYEQKDNNGALFANDKKTSDTQPDYKGQIRVGEKDYWISGWRKVSKNGMKYMSLAVKPTDQPAQGAEDMI